MLTTAASPATAVDPDTGKQADETNPGAGLLSGSSGKRKKMMTNLLKRLEAKRNVYRRGTTK
jgi:hypothetical protein